MVVKPRAVTDWELWTESLLASDVREGDLLVGDEHYAYRFALVTDVTRISDDIYITCLFMSPRVGSAESFAFTWPAVPDKTVGYRLAQRAPL